MQKRYDLIDALRLFFAFCVVLIHVPMLGSSFLFPVFRNAVPFFYVISGFFIAGEDDIKKISGKMFVTSKKWLYMTAKYFIIVTLISIGLHLYLSQPVTLTVSDLEVIFLGNATCASLDVLSIGKGNTGLYTLWFLLSGCYAFVILGLVFLFINKRIIYVLISLLFFCLMYLSLLGVKTPRLFLLAIPFLSLGIYIRQNEERIRRFASKKNIAIVFLLMTIEAVIEHNLAIKVECFFLSPIFISLLLLKAIEYNNNKLVTWAARIGRDNSLNVYIYHRCVYAFFLIFIGVNIRAYAAILVFATTLAFSIMFKKTWRKIQ